MRTRMLALVLLGALACAGRHQAAGPAVAAPPPTPEDVVKQVTAAVEAYRAAYESRSLEGLAKLYEQDDALVVVAQGRALRGWPAVNEELGTFLGRMQKVKLTVGDLEVLALGADGAVAEGSVRRASSDGVATVEETGELTLVFRRVGGEWKIVAEHYSHLVVAD